MKIVIADTGAIISLIHLKQLHLIKKIFGDFYIPEAVWLELNSYDNPNFEKSQLEELAPRLVKIKSKNQLAIIMNAGEAESVILYEELNADYL